ncbi:unnamed protein product [Ixodes hexagonus]
MRECIDRNGVIPLQNARGVGVDGFLELLKLYLKSTFVLFEGGYYLQNEGIYIGSSVAPILCDIYSAMCDRAIVENLDGNSVSKVFRYVDDYLVVTKSSEGVLEDKVVKAVMEVFAKNCGGLTFTHELQDGICLRYLDLKLQFTGSHVRWAYQPRTEKDFCPLIPLTPSSSNEA